MKLLTMKCIRDDGADDASGFVSVGTEYFVKLENRQEVEVKEDAYHTADDNDYADFNRWLEGQVGITDYDIHYYFYPHETEPAIGETYTDADGLVWERVE